MPVRFSQPVRTAVALGVNQPEYADKPKPEEEVESDLDRNDAAQARAFRNALASTAANQAGGYAALDGDGKVDPGVIPDSFATDAEVASAVLAHVNDTIDAHDASAISFDDAALVVISSGDVQGALEDLDAAVGGLSGSTATESHHSDLTVAQGAGVIAYTSRDGWRQTVGSWTRAEVRIVFAATTAGTAGSSIIVNIGGLPDVVTSGYHAGEGYIILGGALYPCEAVWDDVDKLVLVRQDGPTGNIGADPNDGLEPVDEISLVLSYRSS